MTAPFRGSRSGHSKNRLRGPAYTRLGRDVYVLRDAELDLRAQVAAAQLVFPDGVPCLTTSALLLKLPVDDDGLVHLARRAGAAQSRRDDVRIHRWTIGEEQQVELASGLRVADGPRTFADLSEHLDLEALVAVGDVVARRWTTADIDRAVELHGKRRGAVLLKQAVPLLDKGADSPPETRARLRLHAAGFTRMRHKVVVRDLAGEWLGEPDLADDIAKVALQHEGAIHFEKGERQRMKDLGRDDLMRAEDWQVVVSTAEDDRLPERLIAKVTAAYGRQARLLGPHVLPDCLGRATPPSTAGAS